MQAPFRCFDGKILDLLNPKPEQISLENIARGLANTSRFCGQTKHPYSVAQHSVFVAGKLFESFRRYDLATYGLLHDAPEAFLGDWSRPIRRIQLDIKNETPGVSAWYADLGDFYDNFLEPPILWAIWQALVPGGYQAVDAEEKTRIVDTRMLLTEKRDVLGANKESFKWMEESEGILPYPDRIRSIWYPDQAYDYFMEVWKCIQTQSLDEIFPRVPALKKGIDIG